MGARPLGEYIQDQAGPIHYTTLQFTLDIAFLAGAQRVIEHDDFCAVLLHLLANFRQLATSDKGTRMWGDSRAHHIGNRVATGGQHEFLKLPRVFAL
jgi:hypothetical protein